MLNLFTKAKPWIVASLMVATSGFSQNNNSNCQPAPKDCCVKTCPATLQAPTVAAYDAPARTDTRCSWDMWIDASFIYWQPSQDNMDVVFDQEAASIGTIGPQGHYVKQDFDFKPGFKVGLGWAVDYHDNWDFAAEYTRLHTEHSQSNNGSTLASTGLRRAWGIPHSTFDATTQFYQNSSSKWKMNLDVVDANMGRWYYVGTDLTFRSFIGARAVWLGQTHRVATVNDGLVAVTGTSGTVTVKDRLHSWGVGPEIGLNTKWMLGEGVRFYGNVEADILYTDYTRISHSESDTGALGTAWAPKLKANHTHGIRPHMDLELGLAWGSYFDNNNWYIDLGVGYDFQVFFNQNMFMHFVDDIQSANKVNAGNLYLQGLTVTARVDF